MPYLTPDALPDGFICRQLTIPDDVEFMGIVTGALLSLTKPWNFEQIDPASMTPDDTANAFKQMFFEYRDLGDICMLGAIIPSIIDLDPPKFLLCNGDTYNRVDYPRLYAALPSAFIVDADTLQTPDLQGLVFGGYFPYSTVGFDTLFAVVGEDEHTLSTAELASHTHTQTGHFHTEGSTAPTAITIGPGAPAPAAIGALGNTSTVAPSIDSEGGDTPHNNIQRTFVGKFYLVAR